MTCSIEGCDRTARTRGWCSMHYRRAWRHGNPEHEAFLPTVCQMDDCDKPTGVAMAARGLCRMHYKRWRVWGDPFFGGFSRKHSCVIEGCGQDVVGRGWCSKHYTRWTRFGDPLARLKGEVVDGKRICATCKTDLPLSEFGSKSCYCKACVNAAAALRRAANPVWLAKTKRWEASCGACGVAFPATKRRWKYCSIECSRARKDIDNWPYMVARRARLRDAHVETFDRFEIFERDGWVCGICDLPVDPTLACPHPESASLDHVVPIARGGKHARANAQLAHLHCNIVKSDRLTGVPA